MARVRLDDLYDAENDDFGAERVMTKKNKHRKDADDVSEKNRRKYNSCKIKKNRKAKNTDNEDY